MSKNPTPSQKEAARLRKVRRYWESPETRARACAATRAYTEQQSQDPNWRLMVGLRKRIHAKQETLARTRARIHDLERQIEELTTRMKAARTLWRERRESEKWEGWKLTDQQSVCDPEGV